MTTRILRRAASASELRRVRLPGANMSSVKKTRSCQLACMQCRITDIISLEAGRISRGKSARADLVNKIAVRKAGKFFEHGIGMPRFNFLNLGRGGEQPVRRIAMRPIP